MYKKCRNKRLFRYLMIFALIFAGLNTRASEYEKIIDLHNNWLYFNQEYDVFVPYYKDGHGEQQALSLWLDVEEYQYFDLYFETEKALSLYINNELQFFYNSKRNVTIPVDELSDFNHADGKQILITFFHPDGKIPLNNIAIVSKKKYTEPTKKEKEEGRHKQRASIFFSGEFFFVNILLILGAIGVIRNQYYRHFSLLYNLMLNTSSLTRNEKFPFRLLSLPITFLIVANAFMFSFVLVYFYEDVLFFADDFKNVYVKLLVFASGILAIYLAKYFYLWVCAFIFNLTKTFRPHYYEFIRVLFLFTAVVFGMTIIAEINELSRVLMSDFLRYIIYIYLVVNIVRIGFVLNKLTSFRKLYLFSYLCTTEILPLIILVKIVE